MNYKIVSDSAASLYALENVDFACVPLKICAGENEYVDSATLDVAGMVDDLKQYSGKSRSSCPNTHEWLQAFGDADAVFAVAITSNLSGSCSAAMQAAEEYTALRSGAKVCVLDTLSAGPEMLLIIEKLRELILAGRRFEEIETEIRQYMRRTHLVFALKSLTNLARNGRVSPAMAALAGVLGICIVGRASTEGTLEQRHKFRGERKALRGLYDEMKATGFRGGRVRISHCFNPEAANQLQQAILADYPDCDVQIDACGALCSFYAERGGFLVGYEDSNEA